MGAVHTIMKNPMGQERLGRMMLLLIKLSTQGTTIAGTLRAKIERWGDLIASAMRRYPDNWENLRTFFPETI